MKSVLNYTISDDLASNQDYRRFVYIGSLIGSLFLMCFALIDAIFLKLYIDSIAECIGAVILFLIHRKETKQNVEPNLIVVGITTVSIVLLIGVFANTSADGASIWLAIIPFICFLFLEEKLGLILSILLSILFITTMTYFWIVYPEKGFNFFGIATTSGALICSSVLAWAFSDNRAKMIDLLAKQASTDTLTCLLNRRGLMSYFEVFIALYKKDKQNLCVLILDLDYFKLINDNFGHDVGDEVIISCANILKAQLRKTDIVARLGGEEYIALLPNTELEEAKALAYRIKDTIEEFRLSPKNNATAKITASIGITCTTKDRFSFESLYKAADKALYEAKENGRNCIYLH